MLEAVGAFAELLGFVIELFLLYLADRPVHSRPAATGAGFLHPPPQAVPALLDTQRKLVTETADRSWSYSPDEKGSTILTPAFSKSVRFRVATISPCSRA